MIENTTENRMGYYCVIPAKVLCDNELLADEKILYGHISALANKEGYCYASNDYFEKSFMGKNGKPKTKATVIHWLNHLEEKGYIKRINLFHKENPNQIIQRRIYLTDKNVPTLILEGVTNV